ncbi:MAG TPA: response regulator [Terriglobia bacterium]|nr:response regulator [Terriglobia bacterium]
MKTTVGSKHSNSSTLPLTCPLILLVEDDPNARSVLCFSLRSKGYPVEEAAEGSSALRKAEQNRPALVLTDIQMPGMNGIELVHSIRSHKELRDIPILVMTAFDPSLFAEALAKGANDTIQKPIQLTSLFQKIATLLLNTAL